jgi:hypothetical protein
MDHFNQNDSEVSNLPSKKCNKSILGRLVSKANSMHYRKLHAFIKPI